MCIALNNSKQDKLNGSGENQNIKTINSQTLLGTGNITIDGGSTELDNNIEIYDNEDNNFVQYKSTDLDWTAASDNSLTSKNYVDTQLSNKINIIASTTGTLSSITFERKTSDNSIVCRGIASNANSNVWTESTITNAINAKQSVNDTTLTTTTKTIVGGINELVTNKQDTLLDSGDSQNIKTINSQSLLGSGDLTISPYIPGEYKYMPLSVTTMPNGWVKYNQVANRPILLSHFLSDFPTAVSNPSFDIGTNNDYQINWIPTSTLGALNFTDNTTNPATNYGFVLEKSQLWQSDPDGTFSAERVEEEKLLLNEFKNKNINI